MSLHASRLGRFARALLRCRSAIALTEFAYAAPLLAALGVGGLEVTNIALARMKVSQIASNLADVVARAGISNGAGMKLVRETDINDSFDAVARQAGNMNLLANGRVILSSLERNASNGNWIRWQRCHGTRTTVVSAYGPAGTGATGTAFLGMGPAAARVQAPDNASAVMFVEVSYEYEPLIRNSIFGAKTIRSEAAFIVRDRRDLTTANNPGNPTPTVTARTC